MSVRSDFVTALKARLETITVANGYGTEVGARVFVWRKHPVLPEETPALLVEDTVLTRNYSAIMGMAENTLTVEILAVVASATTLEDSRKMEADIVKCLSGWESGGGLADSVLVQKMSIMMQQHEQLVAAVQVTVAVVYTTARNHC